LILPPFQKQGHGEKLLNSIYNSHINNIKDFTVEDPSISFSHLRNLVDAKRIQNAGFTDKLAADLKSEIIDAIQEHLKIHPTQIKILHEIFLLRNTNMCDPQAAKKYRLSVKRRLHKLYSDILSGFEDKEVQKRELHQIYEEVETQYKAVISRLK